MARYYRIQTASEQQMFTHLDACSNTFIPPLWERLNLAEYVSKLHQYAVTFEAWEEALLAGLAAAYFNDRQTGFGFLSNVSVLPEYLRSGIASRMLTMTIQYGREQKFKEIRLEVAQDNMAALQLYEKFHFAVYESTAAVLKMKYVLL